MRSDSVYQGQGTATYVSIHVCIKCVWFYKCLLAFITFKLCFFYSDGSKSDDTVESGESGDYGESGDPVGSIDSGKSD